MKNNIIIFLTIIGLIIAGFTYYYQVIYKEKTIVNIEKISEVLLTNPMPVSGLKAHYTYNDSISVDNLWQTTFIVKNIGNKTIYGAGFQNQSIRDSHIPISIIECDRVLSATITNENNGAFMVIPLKITIVQWKPKEYIEITTLTEGINPPKLIISDREIKDAEITYSVYSPGEIKINQKIIEHLPTNVINTLKWIITSVMGFLLLLAISQVRKSYLEIDSKAVRVLFVILLLIFLSIILMPLLWMF
ncbi:MAG: hypothetical protein LBI15_11600 [Dysgonamonadaceae bacterium]|jgi:hypothetical protein|nr:hypothetical protein [Dysgonamonadaceae bacterium]